MAPHRPSLTALVPAGILEVPAVLAALDQPEPNQRPQRPPSEQRPRHPRRLSFHRFVGERGEPQRKATIPRDPNGYDPPPDSA